MATPEEIKSAILKETENLVGDGATRITNYQTLLDEAIAMVGLAVEGCGAEQVKALLGRLSELHQTAETLYELNGGLEQIAAAAAAIF